jgi:hypothetical protein
MATSAYISQASGMAAVLCREYGLLPRDLYHSTKIKELQQRLSFSGQFIPNVRQTDKKDLVQRASISASSELSFQGFEEDFEEQPLDLAVAQLLPLKAGLIPEVNIHAYSKKKTTLKAEFRLCSRTGSYTPDETIAEFEFSVNEGKNCFQLKTDHRLEADQYVFILFHKNPDIHISRTRKRVTGILSVFNTVNYDVSNYGKQEPPDGIGMESFEFWTPQRRPAGNNIAFSISNPLRAFEASNISNGIARPTTQPNAWVADFKDLHPTLKIAWEKPVNIKTILLSFDTDFDHPMESVLMLHPENIMPFCVQHYRIFDDSGNLIAEKNNNYQTRNRIELEKPLTTSFLVIEADHPSADAPAAIFSVSCFGE